MGFLCFTKLTLQYIYCNSELTGDAVMKQVCPDSLQCALIDKDNSYFAGMDSVSGVFKTCVFQQLAQCQQFCSKSCIQDSQEVSYIGKWGGQVRSDWLGGYVCPRGKYNPGVGLADVPVDQTNDVYCFSKTYVNGTRVYINITGPSRMGCNMLTAVQNGPSAAVAQLLLDRVEFLLFQPFGFTESECAMYCAAPCVERWEDTGVAVRNRTERYSGLVEYFGYIVGPFYCPKGSEKMPSENQKTDEEIEEEAKKKLSPGAIAGIVIGSIGVLTVITLGLIWYMLKARELSLPKLIKERAEKAKKLRDETRKEHKKDMKDTTKGLAHRIV